MNSKDANNQISEHEAIRRREAALKRMLCTPPTRHTESAKKRKPKKAKNRRRAKTKSA